MGKIAKKLKGILLALALFTMSGKEISEDLASKQLSTQITVPQAKIDLNLETNYSYSNLGGNPNGKVEDMFDLLDAHDQDQVYSILNDIGNNKITSGEQLAKQSKNISENQDLSLLAIISGSYLYNFNYSSKDDLSDPSQQYLFNILQNDSKGNFQDFGTCRQISTGVEELSEDLGKKASALTALEDNIGHAYTLIKLQDGLAIVNSGEIFKANTKNVEEILREYQNTLNNIDFQHQFFEDNKFKYNLITDEGEKFLNFIDYDSSSLSLRNKIINVIPEDYTRKMDVNLGNNENSLGIYNIGRFDIPFRLFNRNFDLNIGTPNAKVGTILLPMDNRTISVGETNLKGTLTFPIFNAPLEITSNLGFISGNISQESGREITGADDYLAINTLNKDGLNLGTRISANLSAINLSQSIQMGILSSIFYDANENAGISYKFSSKNYSLTPYFIEQANVFPMRLSDYDYSPSLEELTGGISVGLLLPKDTSLLLTPYYSWKPWENGIGTDLEIKNKNAGIKASAYAAKSTYEFAPDSLDLKLEGNVNIRKLQLGANYNLKEKDYSGEITQDNSFEVKGTIKL
ncbi:MAG: hypothetical protein WAU65_03315 [Candidatus Nanoarchaeia archaeon]